MSNPFHNHSTVQLADDYGDVDAKIKSLELKKKDLKAELELRDARFVQGNRFTLTLSEQSTTRLDTKKLKEALGADICAEFENTSVSLVARVKANVQSMDIDA